MPNIMVHVHKQDEVIVKQPKDAERGQYVALVLGPIRVWLSRDNARTIAAQVQAYLAQYPSDTEAQR